MNITTDIKSRLHVAIFEAEKHVRECEAKLESLRADIAAIERARDFHRSEACDARAMLASLADMAVDPIDTSDLDPVAREKLSGPSKEGE